MPLSREEPVDPAYAAACLEKFHAFTHEVDRDRGLRFEDYAPEMARFRLPWLESRHPIGHCTVTGLAVEVGLSHPQPLGRRLVG